MQNSIKGNVGVTLSASQQQNNTWVGLIVLLATVLFVLVISHRADQHRVGSGDTEGTGKLGQADPLNVETYDGFGTEEDLKSPAGAVANSNSMPSASPNTNNNNKKVVEEEEEETPVEKEPNTEASSSSSSTPAPRFAIISQGESGGLGVQFAAMSRLCYANMHGSNHYSVTYKDNDHQAINPKTRAKYFNASIGGPVQDHGGYPNDGSYWTRWAKYILMKRTISELELGQNDWVIWMDRDTYIIDPSQQLIDIILQNTKNNNEIPHLVVGLSQDGKLLNTKVFALRVTQWSLEFLESWWNDRNAVLFSAENGPFLHAVLRGLVNEDDSDGVYEDECSFSKLHKDQFEKNSNSFPPERSDSEFWSQDFVTPFLKCYQDVLKKKAPGLKNPKESSTSCIFGEGGGDREDTTTETKNGLIPSDSKKISFQCMFSNKNKFNRDGKAWINQGNMDKYKELALGISDRFKPRCF